MKVFAEVLPEGLSRAIYRINSEMRKYAPDSITFYSNPDEADLQILDVIGVGSMEFLYLKDYIILQHCFLTTETQDPAYWLPIFKNARLVMSYHDLYSSTGTDDFLLYRAPWGIDDAVFCNLNLSRNFTVLTTGFDLNGEAIRECYLAAKNHDASIIQIGADFGWNENIHVYNDISDEELVKLYNQCHYVSGLRRGEGFELPVLEGLACGTRPVCFDTAAYKYWFNDFAVYVPELPPDELIVVLTELFSNSPNTVTEKEREKVVEQFSWQKIFGDFWTRILTTK